MTRRKLIIDTDCGSDDAMAIAMALRDERYQILLISTVSGNVKADQAAKNVLTVIGKAGTYAPPVYVGSMAMLKRDFVGAADTHGEDGMSDQGLVDDELRPAEGDGIAKILETLHAEEAGTVDLICLGPLTNIALAIRRDPETMRKVRKVVAMGTSFEAGGNVTDWAEFNVWADAEAFKEVLDFGFADLLLVSWDASLGAAVFRQDEIKKLEEISELGHFLVTSNLCLLDLNRERFGEDILDMADPAAMCAALKPEAIAVCERHRLKVELGEERYGYVEIADEEEKLPEAAVCTKLHAEAYKEYVYGLLSD